MTSRSALLLVAVGLATACSGLTPVTEAPASAPVPAPVLDSFAPTAQAFILSTNEPFWQARVEGEVLVLTGLDGERRLEVTRNQALLDGRHVMARDGSGQVEVRIAPMLCQDSMSGATFPYTGRLSFDDGQPITGCARPASDPPPGEPGQDQR
jgi:uncharacterized membrane protein